MNKIRIIKLALVASLALAMPTTGLASNLNRLFQNFNHRINSNEPLVANGYKLINKKCSKDIAFQIISYVYDNNITEKNITRFSQAFYNLKLHPDSLKEIIRELRKINNSYIKSINSHSKLTTQVILKLLSEQLLNAISLENN